MDDRGNGKLALPRTKAERFDPRALAHNIAADFLERIAKRVDFAWGTVALLDRRTGLLKTVASSGEEMDFIAGFRFRFGNGLSAWALERQKMVTLRNIHHGRRHRHHPVRSFLAIPLVHQNVGLGTLTLAHREPHAFSDRECLYLSRASRRLARALYPLLSYELGVEAISHA